MASDPSTTAGVSRRALFGLGLGRVAQEGLERLEELQGAADQEPPAPPDREPLNDRIRREWNEGDPRPLLHRLEPAAEALVSAAEVGPGQRVLDVAAGDGNLALAGARRGAKVVAVDAGAAMVARGRSRIAEAGHEVEWHEGDAEALPLPDGGFDAVLSSFGVIWAPQPDRVVAELTRVCRPGGLIGMTAWAPSGFMGRVIALAREVGGWPRDVQPPERWGRYETAYLHLFSLDDLEVHDGVLRLRFADAEELWSVFSSPPGPLAGALASAPEREEEMRGRLVTLADLHAAGSDGGLDVDSGYAVLLARRPQW